MTKINPDHYKTIKKLLEQKSALYLLLWFNENLEDRIKKLINSDSKTMQTLQGECRLLRDIINQLQDIRSSVL